MARIKRQWSASNLLASISILLNPLGLSRHIMRDRLRIPESRIDLPPEWRGRRVISHEQRLLALDGWDYHVFSWRYPELARNSSRRILIRTGRKTAKTTFRLELWYIWWIISYNGKGNTEYMLHTPNLAHLRPVEGRLDQLLGESRLVAHYYRNRNREDKMWKWHRITFHHRIEGVQSNIGGRGGVNQVGLVVTRMMGDEGAFASASAHKERAATVLPDSQQVWLGVPREGDSSIFRSIVQAQQAMLESGKEPEWSTHANWSPSSPILTRIRNRYPSWINPLYMGDTATKDLMGSDNWHSQTAITQVLGMDGAAGFAAFPHITREPLLFYSNSFSAFDAKIGTGALGEMPSTIEMWLSDASREGYPEADRWGIFCDYGFSPSPLVLIVAYKIQEIWYEFMRINGLQMDTVMGAWLISKVDTFLPNSADVIVVDAHGPGRGVLDILTSAKEYQYQGFGHRIYPANFHSTIEDARVKLHAKCNTPIILTPSDVYEGAGVMPYCPACQYNPPDSELKNLKAQAKFVLTQDLVDAFAASQRALIAPVASNGTDTATAKRQEYGIVLALDDVELYEELSNTVGVPTTTGGIKYISPENRDHMTDALRCLAAGERAMNDGSYSPGISSNLYQLYELMGGF